MRRGAFALSLAGLLTVGTLVQGMTGQISQAEVVPEPVSGSAAIVPP